MTTGLVDADIIAHQCGHSGDIVYYTLGSKQWKYKKDANGWADAQKIDRRHIQKHHEPGDLDKILGMVDWRIRDISHKIESSNMRLFLTGSGNYRKDVAKTQEYKGNRKGKAKPYHLDNIFEYLVNTHGAEVVDGKEADDAMGINQGDDTIICTIDKDLLMIPGWHYNWYHDQFEDVREEEAWRYFYAQLLSGDKADHIPGLKGFNTPKGLKRAANVMSKYEDPEDMKRRVGLEYALQHDDPEAMINEIGALIWIQREEDVIWQL